MLRDEEGVNRAKTSAKDVHSYKKPLNCIPHITPDARTSRGRERRERERQATSSSPIPHPCERRKEANSSMCQQQLKTVRTGGIHDKLSLPPTAPENWVEGR